jgi:hypothetical protein
MSGGAFDELPAHARSAWSDLRDRVRSVLGDDLVAMWAYGGTTSLGDPAHKGDLDTYSIVRGRPDDATVRRIDEIHAATAAAHEIDWDAWYVAADAAGRADPPSHAWRDGSRDTSWAINRAHWLAGRYVNLHGPEPAEIVPAPTWDELLAELDRELEHVERHVVEGDTDPYEATYAFLNGSRILHALETRNVALSKAAAGAWALEHLPERWHAALQAAIRAYTGRATAAEEEMLAAEMAPFVAFVREHLPRTDERPENAMPRWSGS